MKLLLPCFLLFGLLASPHSQGFAQDDGPTSGTPTHTPCELSCPVGAYTGVTEGPNDLPPGMTVDITILASISGDHEFLTYCDTCNPCRQVLQIIVGGDSGFVLVHGRRGDPEDTNHNQEGVSHQFLEANCASRDVAWFTATDYDMIIHDWTAKYTMNCGCVVGI